MLALQRVAGNAATMRALGLHRRPVERILQRAPVHLVLGLAPSYFFGRNSLNGVSLYGGMPDGYHVTIYPDLSDAQKSAGLAELRLDRLPDYRSIQFTLFNVTGPSGTHYYFTDRGNVQWMRTNTEASLIDAHWDSAIEAARVIYAALGLDVSTQALYDQLHARGRAERVSPDDTFGRSQPTAKPTSNPRPLTQPGLTGRPQGMLPPHLRRGRPAGAPPPVTPLVPTSAPAQPFAAPAPAPPLAGPGPAQPAPVGPTRNPFPFPFQPFVRAGEACDRRTAAAVPRAPGAAAVRGAAPGSAVGADLASARRRRPARPRARLRARGRDGHE